MPLFILSIPQPIVMMAIYVPIFPGIALIAVSCRSIIAFSRSINGYLCLSKFLQDASYNCFYTALRKS